jgi:hypothetical protein
MAKTDPFSVRLSQGTHNRLMAIIAASDNEVTKSGLVDRAVTLFCDIVEREPSIIPTYDPDAKLSVTQKG